MLKCLKQCLKLVKNDDTHYTIDPLIVYDGSMYISRGYSLVKLKVDIKENFSIKDNNLFALEKDLPKLENINSIIKYSTNEHNFKIKEFYDKFKFLSYIKESDISYTFIPRRVPGCEIITLYEDKVDYIDYTHKVLETQTVMNDESDLFPISFNYKRYCNFLEIARNFGCIKINFEKNCCTFGNEENCGILMATIL